MLQLQLEKRLGSFALSVALRTTAKRLVLFGPSGSGKSVTLHCVAGLMQPDRGVVEIDGAQVFDSASSLDVPPQRRAIGYVPQGAPLFPHLTVAENVAYGLRHAPAGERHARAEELLEQVHLPGYGGRQPAQLSGGEQQRVALARALATQTRLLLLDEPFSALDAPVRAALREEILELQGRVDVGWVFVTHDLEEAYMLAEDIAVYQGGRILQHGSRDDVFLHPATVEVARLVGIPNVLPATTVEPGCVRLDESGVTLGVDSRQLAQGRYFACVRAEDVRVMRKDRATTDLEPGTMLVGTVVAERQLGFTVSLGFRIDSRPSPPFLWVDVSRQAYLSLGVQSDKRWQLFLPSTAIHLVPYAGNLRTASMVMSSN
ncbi:MAG TPA: ABC transporter ATP-binding protein [Chloroflexota bacterium]|nr:ABC transporter ATP-binding protein [Chloroflexota bacterium]